MATTDVPQTNRWERKGTHTYDKSYRSFVGGSGSTNQQQMDGWHADCRLVYLPLYGRNNQQSSCRDIYLHTHQNDDDHVMHHGNIEKSSLPTEQCLPCMEDIIYISSRP